MLAGRVEEAQHWKLTLEQAQRRDKALREQGARHGARSAAPSPCSEGAGEVAAGRVQLLQQ
jgi:hypothetical protein